MIQVSKIESVIDEIKIVVRSEESELRVASMNSTSLLALPFFIEKAFDSKDVTFLRNKKERYMRIKKTEIHFYKYESSILKPIIQKSFKNVIFYD